MTHSPIQNPEHFLDSDNPRYNRAVVILEWLIENQDGGDYSYVEISKDTDIPQTSVREFLVPDVWVWRSYDYLKELRERNKQAYMYYVSNSRNPQAYHEKKEEYGCEINISKFHYLEFVAHLHGCRLRKDEDEKCVVLEISEEEQKKDLIPELLEIDENLL